MKLVRIIPAILSVLSLSAWAAPMDLDAGLRASIWDENYDLGVGGELGLIYPASPAVDLGLHLNYTQYTAKTVDFEDVQEMTAYIGLYFVAYDDGSLRFRIGPHAGGGTFDGWAVDLGGDATAVFKIMEKTSIYATFIPAYIIGANSQGVFKVGFGVEYRIGG